ncbi:prolyl oligopeptidase family serine peptidase [Anaerobranca gottschalkii]|uniref:prolyl oligopeptidase n=1 Tax=Anaerobranca gottschalkii DSM 13577 TaxID=1120990 RepID=A0A1I0AUY7_9FIRM|nr:prolyl oligopeptidase family serine peptidase [Anaerobranca gottschalkii]SES98196.1 prolyl oligopeptidase . Serine peptidase. MEROPS family S09A [Anaerobranca gottschalkii DSM 13577]
MLDELKEAWQRGSNFTKFMIIFWVSAPFVIGLYYWIKESVQKIIGEKVKEKAVDIYHGTIVVDKYRYLENPEDEKTINWLEKQKRITEKYFKNNPYKEEIEKRLKELWNYRRTSIPIEVKGDYFYLENDGTQNQPILYKQRGLEGERQILLDPNKLCPEGTVAITNYSVSKNGKYLAYALSEKGSDWQKIKVLNLESLEPLEDEILWCKFTNISWVGDEGFYYSRFPKPGSVPEEDESNYQKVYFHKINTHQGEDKLIYERPDFKELGFTSIVTEDERYLCFHIWHGTDRRNRFYYKNLEGDGPIIKLLDDADAAYHFIGNKGDTFYFLSDLDTPKGSVIALELNNPDEIIEVIPEGEDVLADAVMVNDGFAVIYRQDAYYQLKLFDSNGDFVKEIQLPGIGTVEGLWGKNTGKELFYNFTSFLYPGTVFRYDFLIDESNVFSKGDSLFDPELYETKQIFYNSKDGTLVSMFITHKKGLELSGDNITVLYGYGGFGISVTPAFSPTIITLLEKGGVYAVANLRGGSEYGEQWHRAGMLENKQNVFDDFIAAAQWLIDNKYTNSRKLSIMGRSNGGLLVAACLVQWPELFGAVVCGVPVIDMLRYHKFTVGRYWIPEYGNPDNPEHFPFLYKYSPLHNIKGNIQYPPVLIYTAEGDDRVVPAHGYKFAAALQKVQKGKNPVILRVEREGGHGQGKPLAKVIEEQRDILAFILKECSLS